MTSADGRRDLRGQSGNAGQGVAGENEAGAIGDWLEFLPDGTVEVRSGKVEMGQGVRTSLTQVVAEELRLPLTQVRLLLGDTGRAPYDPGTVGSRSTPVMALRLQKVAASARELLLHRAAAQLAVPPAELRLAGGAVEHARSGRALSYFALLGTSPREPWSDAAPVTAPDQWTVVGQATRRVNGRAFVTGSHRYTADLQRPGLLHGAVLRAPGAGSRLLALDSRQAAALPGVVVVRDGEFVGVVAPTLSRAWQARAALRAEWSTPQGIAAAELYGYLRSYPAAPRAGRGGGPEVVESGSLEQGRQAAAITLTAEYTTAYIAHVPLEPRAALAEWQGDQLTVWTGTQRPFGVRTELAAALSVPEEQVRVIVPDTGSGYGGKHTGDAAVEAARLARAAGRPVKLVWSREEEFRWAYFRPAALITISSAVDADGRLTAWEYHNYNAGAQAMRPPYRIANQRVAYHPSHSPLRQGSYRALAATANHFARESHIDELAHLAGIEPLQFRLRNLEDARLRAVLLAAAERFGWDARPHGAGRGCGMACGTEKGSYVATCAEVEVGASGALRVTRIVEAFECGAIINPAGLTAQVEGAVIMALGGALYEQIDFAAGRITTDRLSRYRVPRSVDIPPIHTVLLDRRDLPSAGAGETPIVGPAPALANAIFAATGQRRRALPLLASAGAE